MTSVQDILSGTINELTVTGFSPWRVERIVASLRSDANPTNLPGDFVLSISGTYQNEHFTILVSSVITAVPYFHYTNGQGELYHHKNFFDLYRLSGLKWAWNRKALFCLNNFDHLIGDDSLHPEIKRLKNASILVNFRAKTWLTTFQEFDRQGLCDLEQGIHIYKSLCDDYLDSSRNIFLSLSAGMDSRLLLATCLAKGIKPLTATMGKRTSTDVKIAGLLAKRFALEHRSIELEVKDYLDASVKRQIIYATGGTKSLNNWHTFIYINKVDYSPQCLHFAGSNGELTRSYYFDKGVFAKVLQLSDLGFLPFYFSLKINKGNRYVIKSLYTPEVAEQVKKEITGLAVGHNDMEKFDHFYATQRVRHFIGNGVALYNLKFKTTSPFLDNRFIKLAQGLSRKYKLNSIFHKAAIRHLCPDLLSFPNSENSSPINDFGSDFYFLRKSAFVGYGIGDELLSSHEFQSTIVENPDLDDWVDKKERVGLFENKEMRTISFLATLAETIKLIKEIDAQRR